MRKLLAARAAPPPPSPASASRLADAVLVREPASPRPEDGRTGAGAAGATTTPKDRSRDRCGRSAVVSADVVEPKWINSDKRGGATRRPMGALQGADQGVPLVNEVRRTDRPLKMSYGARGEDDVPSRRRAQAALRRGAIEEFEEGIASGVGHRRAEPLRPWNLRRAAAASASRERQGRRQGGLEDALERLRQHLRGSVRRWRTDEAVGATTARRAPRPSCRGRDYVMPKRGAVIGAERRLRRSARCYGRLLGPGIITRSVPVLGARRQTYVRMTP